MNERLRVRPDPARVVEDRAAEGIFRVRHEAFLDADLFELEMARIFESTWVFVGLENALPKAHDFLTTQIGRVPVLLTRDGHGVVRGFLNSCRHRGTLLCPWARGNQRVHVCRYHGWTYDSGGRNVGITGDADGQYPAAFRAEDHGLVPIARLANYRGFLFASLSPDVPPLETHLGDARAFLDLVADQGPRGLEFVPGTVTYTFDANWKYQFENGLDYYHFAPTHGSFVQILRQRPPVAPPPGMATDLQDPDPEGQGSYSFAHGHAVTWSVGAAGQGPERRPLPRDPRLFDELRRLHGPTRTKWMLRQRNLTIFPNVQIIDIQSLQLRVWQPLAVDRTRMISHCLAPVGEDPAARRFRIRQYEEFFNPSGLATSDDNVMYAFCQAGYAAAARRGDSQGYARGLGDPPADRADYAHELGLRDARTAAGSRDFGDETCFHAGWREWLRLMTREAPR
ncbi:MAG: SRPBCC family protein [Gammaproteobacteria bacterium]